MEGAAEGRVNGPQHQSRLQHSSTAMPPKATQKQKRTHPDEAGRSAKKTRFAQDSPSGSKVGSHLDDETAEGLTGEEFAKQVMEDLEEGGKSRKGRVKTEGYDSDSSDDGEGVVESRKEELRKNKDDDDLDMFAGDEGGAKDVDDDIPGKKKPKFMNLGDIEGQEFGDGENVSDDDDEPEDEDDAIRKAKKGMGYEMSSFNMKDEMEEGKFAEDGTFVRSFDPHQVHDRWMEGLNDDEIKKARRSRKKMEEREQERQRHDEEEGLNRSKEELELELLDWVRPGETVLQTLGRLGSEKKKSEPKSGAKAKGKAAKATLDPSLDVDPGAAHPSQHPENSAIDRVTALASALMALGNLHIYEETHRTLVFSVKEAGLKPRDWVPPSAAPAKDLSTKYEYRWAPLYLKSAPPGGAKAEDTFGPYSREELVAWRDASYFGPAGDRIQLRRVGDDRWAGWEIVV